MRAAHAREIDIVFNIPTRMASTFAFIGFRGGSRVEHLAQVELRC